MVMTSRLNSPQVGPASRESHPVSAGSSVGCGGSTFTLDPLAAYSVDFQGEKLKMATGKGIGASSKRTEDEIRENEEIQRILSLGKRRESLARLHIEVGTDITKRVTTRVYVG